MSHTKCGVRTGGKPPGGSRDAGRKQTNGDYHGSKVPTLQVTFAQNSRRYKMTGFKQVNEYLYERPSTTECDESRHQVLDWLKLLLSAVRVGTQSQNQ